jgi:hypothetical protein
LPFSLSFALLQARIAYRGGDEIDANFMGHVWPYRSSAKRKMNGVERMRLIGEQSAGMILGITFR